MNTDAHGEAHEQHPPTTIRQYVMIGALLAVVTALELAASYSRALLGPTLIPILFVLSGFKFATVVALFMHLRYERPLLTRLFLFGLILAACIMLALIALFWTDITDAVGMAGRAG